MNSLIRKNLNKRDFINQKCKPIKFVMGLFLDKKKVKYYEFTVDGAGEQGFGLKFWMIYIIQ